MVKLEGVFTTVEGDKCKEYQETHFFQNGRHVFFVGEGRIGKGKRSKPFKNHGYAEIPEGGLKEARS